MDVREQDEFESGHIDGWNRNPPGNKEHPVHLSLGGLEAHLGDLPRDRPILAYCGHGERAATAISILERAGLGPLLNLAGGLGAWKKAGYIVA